MTTTTRDSTAESVVEVIRERLRMGVFYEEPVMLTIVEGDVVLTTDELSTVHGLGVFLRSFGLLDMRVEAVDISSGVKFFHLTTPLMVELAVVREMSLSGLPFFWPDWSRVEVEDVSLSTTVVPPWRGWNEHPVSPRRTDVRSNRHQPAWKS